MDTLDSISEGLKAKLHQNLLIGRKKFLKVSLEFLLFSRKKLCKKPLNLFRVELEHSMRCGNLSKEVNYKFEPEKKRLTKDIIGSILIFFEVIIFLVVLFVIEYFLEPQSFVSLHSKTIGSIVMGSVSVTGLGCALIILLYQYRSIYHILRNKEMTAFRGFIRKIMKVTPIRVIINLSVFRGWRINSYKTYRYQSCYS